MKKWVSIALLAVLSSCSPVPTTSSQAALPATSTSTSGSPSPSVVANSDLPAAFIIEGQLLSGDCLRRVVAELRRLTGDSPVLKLDVTATAVTLSALLPGNKVDALRWENGTITRVDSDVQYFKQATFSPSDYPLDQTQRMFDVADMRGLKGTLTLQIVEYRAGQVMMTVTSRPESGTVFFHRDGTAIPQLSVTSVSDIEHGLAEVVGGATNAYAVGFNATKGYWSDIVGEKDGVVLNRTRLRGLPMFETKRAEKPAFGAFDPQQIKAAPLAKAIARAQKDPTQPCDVTVDLSLGRSAPVAKIDCQGSLSYADLEGRDMTGLVVG